MEKTRRLKPDHRFHNGKLSISVTKSVTGPEIAKRSGGNAEKTEESPIEIINRERNGTLSRGIVKNWKKGLEKNRFLG